MAKELGFSETLEKFSRIDFSSFSLTPENESAIKKEILGECKNQAPGLEDVAVIFSASGSSIRPIVNLKFKLDEKDILSKANIAPRTDMKYPMIIGRRDLKKFLIEVK